jgi:hypothetical protein
MKSDNIPRAALAACENALLKGNYDKFLQQARLVGTPLKEEWNSQFAKNSEKNKFTSNPKFKKILVEKIESWSFNPIDSDGISSLKTKLFNLQTFLVVWDDPGLSREAESEATTENKNKQIRQSVKHKTNIDKDVRYAIKITLLTLSLALRIQADEYFCHDNAYKKAGNYNEEYYKEYGKEFGKIKHDRLTSFKEITTSEGLLEFVSDCTPKLNSTDETTKEEQTSTQEIEKIAHAISSFQTPTKKKKALKYLGIFIAWIASLAAGISTGGAVYLLFPTLLVPAIIAGVFIFAVGYSANFRFFSKNLPNFLLSLVKKGGPTELINREGKREQLSRVKRYLLLPLALLASLTVGIAGAALTYTAILSFVSSVLPMLAIFWPPLPIVIVAILALSVLVVLSVSTFNAIIEMLKTLPSLKYLKDTILQVKFSQLSARQIFSHVILALLIPLALFGLVYFRITAGVDLSTLTGLVSAIVTGIAAFIAQIAFTVLSINKLKEALVRPFDSAPIQTENPATTAHKSTYSRIKSSLSSIFATICLVSNAIGNAVLVYTGSVLSILGAIACALNSLAGNIPEQNRNQAERATANDAIVNKLIKLEKEGLDNTASETNPVLAKDEPSNPEETIICTKKSDCFAGKSITYSPLFATASVNSEVLVKTKNEPLLCAFLKA